MSLQEAMELKEQASSAWSRGEYDGATDLYSQAIAIILDIRDDIAPREQREQLKILYSNRCAAYLKLNRANDALEDANKCCQMDSEWSKGHVRKGDALYALGKYTESFNSYNAALRLAPGDRGIQDKSELAQRAIRFQSTRWSTPDYNGEAGGLPDTFKGDPSSLLGRASAILKASVVVNGLLCLLPFLGLPFSYKLMLFSVLASGALSLYVAHGSPRFTSNYGLAIVADPTAVFLFLAAMQLISPPKILAMTPILMTEIVQLAPIIQNAMRSSTSAKLIEGILDRLLPPLVREDTGAWARMSVSQRYSIVTARVLLLSAVLEVFQGIVLAVELLFPGRNFILLYLWWQYLRMRYMMDRSGNVKHIFASLDQQIMRIISHRSIPAIVRQGYTLCKELLRKQVEPVSANNL